MFLTNQTQKNQKYSLWHIVLLSIKFFDSWEKMIYRDMNKKSDLELVWLKYKQVYAEDLIRMNFNHLYLML